MLLLQEMGAWREGATQGMTGPKKYQGPGNGEDWSGCRLVSKVGQDPLDTTGPKMYNNMIGGHNWATLSLGYITTETWSSRLAVGHKADGLAQ
jgi:hypothetical protein